MAWPRFTKWPRQLKGNIDGDKAMAVVEGNEAHQPTRTDFDRSGNA